MAELVAAVATNAMGNLAAAYASPYFSYFFRYGEIVRDFKRLQNQLECLKDRVQNDVNEAKRQTEVIERDVQGWLTKAGNELEKAHSLAIEIERSKCFSWCPCPSWGWGWRYCLSKKVAKKTVDISQLLEMGIFPRVGHRAQLLEIGNFPRVGHRAPLEGIEWISPKNVMPSESSKLALNGIMKALNRDDVNIIGLFGMAGVGKTTLAEEVGRQAREKGLFDKVVKFTVSQNPNISNIQDRIAEIFGLTFQTNTKEGRAEELFRRLEGGRKSLIIADDVWTNINLQDIGIPFGVDYHGCKVLLTTRSEHVCFQMDCQDNKFHLNILSEDEAWALFKDKAGLQEVSSALNDVAKEVARECKGLPLAIVTVASALNGESLEGWTAAKRRFEDSRYVDNEDVCGVIYRCVQLSYDYLKKDDIRSCFLLCSLFPEDYHIPVELLIICGIGQGLFRNVDLIEDLRREIRVALKTLQKSSLLFGTNDEEHVRMHDVVRDFAHWLTSTGENKFMVKDGWTEWPMNERSGSYTAISLGNCDITNFPSGLEFTSLNILFLMGKTSLEPPKTFFEEMKALRVLLLQNVILGTGEALQSLEHLQTLCFVDCKINKILLGDLQNLEIVAFFGCNIEKPPLGLEELRRLKSLYISYGEKYTCFTPTLLSGLSSLQELHVTNTNNFDILELNSFSRLTALTLKVSSRRFQRDFVFPKLERYNIAVIEDPDDIAVGLIFSMRTLKVSDFSFSLSAFKKLFCNVENLTLINVIMVEPDVITTAGAEGPVQAANFQYLKLLEVSYCNRLKSLFSPMLARNLLQLTNLRIEHCEELEVIIQLDQTSGSSSQGHLQPIFLPSLEFILIEGCNKLKSLFPSSVTNSLSKVRELKILGASKLEQVFGYQGELAIGDDQKVIVFPELREFSFIELPCLEGLAPVGYHFQFRGLNCFEVRQCPKLTTSFSMDSELVVHAITKTPRQVQNKTMEGSTTVKEIVEDNGPTCNDLVWRCSTTVKEIVEDHEPICNDIVWHRSGDQGRALPLYIKEEETTVNHLVEMTYNFPLVK